MDSMDTYKTVVSMNYSGTVGLHCKASPQMKSWDGLWGNPRVEGTCRASSHRTCIYRQRRLMESNIAVSCETPVLTCDDITRVYPFRSLRGDSMPQNIETNAHRLAISYSALPQPDGNH